MIRSIATVLVVVGLIVGVGLVDRDRDQESQAAGFAAAADPAIDASTPGEPAAEPYVPDTSYLASCLSSAPPPGDAPPAPPLSPRGVAEISERVERLRELEHNGPVDVSFLSDEEIGRRVSTLVDDGYPASLALRQGLVYEMLGAIPPDSDLLELTRAALASQVIGLYARETEELLVASSGEAGAIEEITLAHEIEHALAADELGLPLPVRAQAGRSDRDRAAQSLIEGDATLTMNLYALSFIDASELLSLGGETGPAIGGQQLEGLPYILQRNLTFPYDAGLEYVCGLYEKGGWDAVDRAYDQPPRFHR